MILSAFASSLLLIFLFCPAEYSIFRTTNDAILYKISLLTKRNGSPTQVLACGKPKVARFLYSGFSGLQSTHLL